MYLPNIFFRLNSALTRFYSKSLKYLLLMHIALIINRPGHEIIKKGKMLLKDSIYANPYTPVHPGVEMRCSLLKNFAKLLENQSKMLQSYCM